jgi:branched-chain amino acid transport system substrate-binding protein
MGLALAVPQAQEGLGSVGINLISEQGWNANYPFIDPLTGLTCEQLAEKWEKDTGTQRTNAIGHLGKFAWAIDILKRTKNPDDKESILDAIKTTKLTVINGPIDFTAPVDPDPSVPDSYRPHPNVYKPVYTGGQWQKGTKWPVEEITVANICAPGVATVPVQPYVYE